MRNLKKKNVKYLSNVVSINFMTRILERDLIFSSPISVANFIFPVVQ